jgi:hypothetical protein
MMLAQPDLPLGIPRPHLMAVERRVSRAIAVRYRGRGTIFALHSVVDFEVDPSSAAGTPLSGQAVSNTR